METQVRKTLTKVDQTGRCGRRVGESLIVEGLIEFGGPRLEINHPFNCLRLTAKGRALLETEAAHQNLLNSNGPHIAEAAPCSVQDPPQAPSFDSIRYELGEPA